MEGALAVGFVLVELDDALLQGIIDVYADLSDHDHEKFISKVALLEYAFAFIVYSLVELLADIGQSFSSVVRKEGHVLL